MRYAVIKPILSFYKLNFLFSDFNFALLVITTVLLAAGGYAINDYFDSELDRKAGKKTIVDNGISKKTALNIFISTNVIAIILGFYISIEIHFYKLGFTYIIISGLLWFYSQTYKKSFLIGNLIIAFLAALVPLIVLPYEILPQYSLNKTILIQTSNNLHQINNTILFFSIFAFLLTLIREIIKDIEDFDADNTFNYRTLPIIAGIKSTKIIIALLSCFSAALFLFLYLKLNFNTTMSMIYAVTLIITPLAFTAFLIFRAKDSKQYHFLSLYMKAIMFFGILFSLFIKNLY
jgi:4-hydroxybenzoate polyprenyltransferase